jgi:hypothetical protein
LCLQMAEPVPKAVSLDDVLKSSSFDFSTMGRRQARQTLDEIQARIAAHSEHVKILTEHTKTLEEHLREHPDYVCCPRVYASKITPEKIESTYSINALKIMVASMMDREFQLTGQYTRSWETDMDALDKRTESGKLRNVVEQRKKLIEGKLAMLIPGKKLLEDVPFINGVLEREKAECRRVRSIRTKLIAAHPHLAEARQG